METQRLTYFQYYTSSECYTGFQGLQCEVPTIVVDKIAEPRSNTTSIVLGILIPLFVLIGVAILVLWFLRKKTSKNRPRAVEPKYNQLIFGNHLEKKSTTIPDLITLEKVQQ